ncbi:MAG: heavy metal response regulator transcription factor [Burkholderiales bacterium]|nr:heavy metal response regulator transcription factor [Burkholderiales bacterium]
MRILVVEDEKRLSDYLHKGLTEQGHTVDVVHDGMEGRRYATGGDYDLILLDVMLPGVDGFGVLKALRAGTGANARTPVLMLTARDKIEDRVRGLEGGADDYLVKPFAFSELLARIGAVTRRSAKGNGAQRGNGCLTLDDLELDPSARRATRAGRKLDLTAKEFALLLFLLKRQGQILTRTTIAEQVWDMHFDSETNLVEVAIRRLRAKLDEPFGKKLLHTERGMGYVLEDRGA